MMLKSAAIWERRLSAICKSLILAAAPVASAFAADMSSNALAPTPMFARISVYDWSGFYAGANAGAGWSSGGNAMVSRPILASQPISVDSRGGFFGGGQLGYRFRSGAFIGGIETDAQKNILRWRQIETDAKGRLSPDAASIVPASAASAAKVHGALDPVDPKAFGGLAPMIGAGKPAPAAGDLAKRLARMGADRQARDALLGPNGALSAGAAAKNFAQMGAVVQGVNDQPAADEIAAAGNSAATTGPIQSYPLSASALADQQNRAARYGGAGAAPNGGGSNVIAATAPRAGARPRAFDASEGTPLDPLLNTTYDLNYPKVVPSLK